MSSKRELREQMALLRADVEAWRDTAVRFAASRDVAAGERDAVFAELAATRKQRDAAVDAQYVDRAELVEARDMIAELVDERNAALERVAKLGDIVSDLRARVAELEARVVVEWRDPEVPDRAERDAAIKDAARTPGLTAPEPRPFRVGDRVRVAEGATYRRPGFGASESRAAGCDGRVTDIWSDGDLLVDTGGVVRYYVSPEFCTLIEDEPERVAEPNIPAPRTAVEVVYTDETLARFDADTVEIAAEAPAYVLRRGDGLVAVIAQHQARSVAVVTR